MTDIKAVAEQTIECMRVKGADKGQVFVTESEHNEFNAENGEFTLFRTTFNAGIDILLYKDMKKGSYYANSVTAETIENAVETALESAASGNEDEAYDIAPYQGEIKANKGVSEPDTDRLFERTKELAEDIRKNYPKVVIQSLIASYGRRHMYYINTNGTVCEEYNGAYNVNIQVAGHEGDITTGIVYTGILTENLDVPFIEQGDIRQKLENAEAQLEAKPMEGKFTGTMLLTPLCLNQFIWNIITLVNGSAILEKTSIWLDKQGQQVADRRISIRLDNEDESVVCGETLTFDGFKSEGYDLIRDGELKNFVINYYISRKTGYERSKNGQFNFIVKAGDKSVKDIIKGIKNGILVGAFSGGQPSVNGDFSGVAKDSFLIRDGEIAGALSETMINGNIADMLMNLNDISSETLRTGSDILPYMAFDGILISGK